MDPLTIAMLGAAATTGYGAYSSSSRQKKEEKSQKKYLKDIKSGKAYKQIDPYSKSQRKLLDWLSDSAGGHRRQLDITRSPMYQSGSDYLERILSGDPEATADFEAPYMREFYEQSMPELAERFAGAGAGGSSAFASAAAHEGGALQEQLAALRGGLQQNALGMGLNYAQAPITNRMGMMGQALGAQPYQTTQVPYMSGTQGPGFMEQMAQNFGGAAGMGLGMYGGNQMGRWLSGSASPGSTQRYLNESGGYMPTFQNFATS